MKVKVKKRRSPDSDAVERRSSIKIHKWFHRMSNEEMQEVFQSRNREITFESVQQIFRITFCIVITLILSVLILTKLF